VPETPTEKSQYKSRWGGDFVSAPQYIAELMCERIASARKQSLVPKFWNTTTWKKVYYQQIIAANTVLKLYSPEAVIAAISKTRNVLSLRSTWFNDVILAEQDRINKVKVKVEIGAAKLIEPPKTQPVIEKPREAFVPKSNNNLIKKLKDLE
jgi:hypothetical protein